MTPDQRWRSAKLVAWCVAALTAGCLSDYAISDGGGGGSGGAGAGGAGGGDAGGRGAGGSGGQDGSKPGCAAGTGEPGSALWALGLGDLEDQALRAAASDSLGNVIVAGVFEGDIALPGGPTLSSAGLNDYFLVKFDCAGNPLWSLRLGDAADQPADVWLTVDPDDDVILAGALDGTLELASGALSATGPGERNIFVAKFDAEGTNLWGQRFEGTGVEVADDVAVDANGDVFFAGRFSGTMHIVGPDHVAEDGEDLFVAKLNGTTGAPVWSIDRGGPGEQTARGIAVDSVGRVLVVGSFDGELTLDTSYQSAGSNANNDAFIVQLDAEGTPLWSHVFGDAASQEALQVVVGEGDQLVVVGENEGDINPGGGTFTANEGGWVARYDSSGNHLFSRGFGGIQRLREVALDGAGNVIFGGNFLDPNEFGVSAGDVDLFVAKLSPDLATITWSQTAGADDLDATRGLAVDPFGNVILGGWFRLTVNLAGKELSAPGGNANAFITKLTP